jgi:hypothetical protein
MDNHDLNFPYSNKMTIGPGQRKSLKIYGGSGEHHVAWRASVRVIVETGVLTGKVHFKEFNDRDTPGAGEQAGTSDDFISPLGSWVPFAGRPTQQIQLYNSDSTVSVDVYVKAFSDMDISGSTMS